MQRSVSAAGSLNKSPPSPPSGSTSIIASVSFQSHFSASSSAPRFRTLPVMDLEKQVPWREDLSGRSLSSPPVPPLPLPQSHRSRFPELQSRFKWSLLVYACFSALFLPVSILQTFGYLPCSFLCAIRRSAADMTDAPYLLDLTQDSRFLSKITSVGSDASSIHPFALRGVAHPDDITACLWSKSDQIESVLSWSKSWPGPLSLVLITTTSPQSAQHRYLLERVSHLYSRASANSSLSVHLLHVKSSVQDNPNAYVNLARLFAETGRVVLFPHRLFNIDPPSAYSLYQKHSRSDRRFKPVVMTVTGRSVFPFSSFSPILLRRDDPVWCDERFSLFSSGASDWQECLWQFWIANYGAVRALTVSESSWPLESTIDESSVRTTIRYHLHTKFREETCLLATRQVNALLTGEGREAHPKHVKQAKWLNKACRQWKFAGA